MTLENTIQAMLDFGGDSYLTRKDCYNHLFCTIGTGYEWVNGELVSDDFDKQLSRYESVDVVKAVERPNALQLWEAREKTYSEMSEQMHNKHEFWYPLSKRYSHLFNYPDDIKPDWLEAINECRQMLKDDGIDIDCTGKE